MLLQPSADEERIGVAWLDATADAAWQQRVTDSLAAATGVDPRDVEPDAVEQARWGVAYAVPRAQAAAHRAFRERLGRAVMAFRGGSFELAASDARTALAGLHLAPGTPGAPRLAWRAHVLLAQIAWATGNHRTTDAALRAAAILDPDATLSTRQVPPDLVARHNGIRAELDAAPKAWVKVRVPGRGPVDLEVDGRVTDHVPAGDHFLVVRRPGYAPVAQHGPVTVEVAWGELQVSNDPPTTRAAAEAVCRGADLDWFLLARRKGERVGLQRYHCGHGFASPSFLPGEELAQGVREAVTASGATAATSALVRDPWPAAVAVMPPDPRPPDPVDRRPWFRRVWVWAVIGTVLAGAVTAGVVVGTRNDGRRVRVDVPSFTDGG